MKRLSIPFCFFFLRDTLGAKEWWLIGAQKNGKESGQKQKEWKMIGRRVGGQWGGFDGLVAPGI